MTDVTRPVAVKEALASPIGLDRIVLDAHLHNHDLPVIALELLDLRRMVEVALAGIAAERIATEQLVWLAHWLDRMGGCLDQPEYT